MKTQTYLRLSLLIPLVMWVVSLVVYFALSAWADESFGLEGTLSVFDWIFLFFAFYLIGVVLWILPYLLLALILFLWTFIGKPQTSIKVFALSPVAMTLLTLAELSLISLGSQTETAMFASAAELQNFANFNALIAAISLGWGYLCVGIGFGLYKLLKRSGRIKDAVLEPVPAVPEAL